MDYGTTNTTAALMLGVTDEKKPRLILMDEWRYNPKDHGDLRLTTRRSRSASAGGCRRITPRSR